MKSVVEGIDLVIMLAVREGYILHLETVKPTVSPDSWIGKPDLPVLDVRGEPYSDSNRGLTERKLKNMSKRALDGLPN